jgi:hypothetical protein
MTNHKPFMAYELNILLFDRTKKSVQLIDVNSSTNQKSSVRIRSKYWELCEACREIEVNIKSIDR